MTEAFWWYLLAGFILGFSISTVWEWLYFRRRRMAIRDRRIAELESTVRTYMVATSVPETSAATEEDWASSSFESPNVYLETEEPPAVSPPPERLPPDNGRAAPTYGFVSATANGVTAPTSLPYQGAQATRVAPVAYAAQPYSELPVTGFQSVAVQPSPAIAVVERDPGENALAPATIAAAAVAAATLRERDEDKLAEEPFEDELSSVRGTGAPEAASRTPDNSEQDNTGGEQAAEVLQASSTTRGDLSKALAALGSLAVVDAVREDDEEEGVESVEGMVAPEDAIENVAVNDDTTAAVQAAAVASAAAARPITSDDLDALRASINDLLDNVSAERAAVEGGMARTTTGVVPVEADGEYYTATINGRTEYVLVRMVQSAVQFARQVRTILSGDRAERPVLHTAPAGELTSIGGMTDAHVERLRVAGITTFGQLGALSTDELRMLLLTTDAADTLDYEKVRSDAARLAAAGEGERA